MTTATEEWPSYCTKGLEDTLANVRGAHLMMKVETIEESMHEARKHELDMLRDTVDGTCSSHPFWAKVGCRAITTAWERELLLAKFKAALESPRFARVTSGHSVAPTLVNVYFASEASPTAVRLAMSIDGRWPEVVSLLGQRAVVRGGQGSPHRS